MKVQETKYPSNLTTKHGWGIPQSQESLLERVLTTCYGNYNAGGQYRIPDPRYYLPCKASEVGLHDGFLGVVLSASPADGAYACPQLHSRLKAFCASHPDMSIWRKGSRFITFIRLTDVTTGSFVGVHTPLNSREWISTVNLRFADAIIAPAGTVERTPLAISLEALGGGVIEQGSGVTFCH